MNDRSILDIKHSIKRKDHIVRENHVIKSSAKMLFTVHTTRHFSFKEDQNRNAAERTTTAAKIKKKKKKAELVAAGELCVLVF